jgi:hypothetical protein
MRIRDGDSSDPGWKQVGSGINIQDPQHWIYLHITECVHLEDRIKKGGNQCCGTITVFPFRVSPLAGYGFEFLIRYGISSPFHKDTNILMIYHKHQQNTDKKPKEKNPKNLLLDGGLPGFSSLLRGSSTRLLRGSSTRLLWDRRRGYSYNIKVYYDKLVGISCA